MGEPVEIEVMGYKAEIKWIKGRPASPPLHPKDTLSVYVELVEDVNGTSGFFVDIPLKNYGKEELRRTIQMYADNGLRKILESHRAQKEKEAQLKARQTDLDHFGDELFEILSK